jgi:anthranilate synthase component 2
MSPSMPERPIVIIDNYDSFTYNLYQVAQAQTTQPVAVFRNDAITFEELLAQKPSGVILSPGPGHPGVERDFGICRDVVLRQEELGCPVLGVCLGHQGIAHHLGGSVIQAPEIMHGKTSMMRVEAKSPIFDGISPEFEAMRYHSLLVAEENLPPLLKITAREVNLGLPMALEHTEKPIYGIQFHPESIGTPEGGQILRNFLNVCAQATKGAAC